MATGPFTLLIDPVAETYEDASGVHELPWHGPHFIGNAVGVEGLRPHAVSFTTSLEQPPTSLIAKHGLYPDANDHSGFTVTNGTKSIASYTAILPKYDASNYFQSDIYGSLAGIGFGGTGFSTVLKVTSTGGDVDITVPLAQNTAQPEHFDVSLWTARALMASDAAADRNATFILNGTEHGMNGTYYPARVIPAGGIATIHGAHTEGAPAAGLLGDPFGIRILDTLNGEVFYLCQIGTNDVDEQGGNSFWPVALDGVYPTEIMGNVNDTNPVDIWEGATGASIAHHGESFWYVDVTTEHIPDDTNFVALARMHEMTRPINHYGEEMGVIRLSRDLAHWTYDELYGAEVGVSDEYTFNPATPRKTIADVYDQDFTFYAFPEFEHTVTTQGFDFQTYGITLTPTECTVHRGTATATEAWQDGTPQQGWLYIADGPAGDPMRFGPGHGRAHFHPSINAYREMALASRPLTEDEWAYLADPEALWGFNLFAEPYIATMDGLPEDKPGTKDLTITVLDAEGDSVPLYGHSLTFTIGEDVHTISSDEYGVVTGTYESVNIAGGSVTFAVDIPEDEVEYEVEVTDISSVVHSILTGVTPSRTEQREKKQYQLRPY